MCINPHDYSSLEYGYELASSLFRKSFDFSAVFAASDSLALGFIQAADEFGIHIPEDLSLLGFDNIVYTALPKIKLSTIDQEKKLQASTAVDLLIELIETTNPFAFTHKLIRTRLIERDSCKPFVQ